DPRPREHAGEAAGAARFRSDGPLLLRQRAGPRPRAVRASRRLERALTPGHPAGAPGRRERRLGRVLPGPGARAPVAGPGTAAARRPGDASLALELFDQVLDRGERQSL